MFLIFAVWHLHKKMKGNKNILVLGISHPIYGWCPLHYPYHKSYLKYALQCSQLIKKHSHPINMTGIKSKHICILMFYTSQDSDRSVWLLVYPSFTSAPITFLAVSFECAYFIRFPILGTYILCQLGICFRYIHKDWGCHGCYSGQN